MVTVGHRLGYIFIKCKCLDNKKVFLNGVNASLLLNFAVVITEKRQNPKCLHFTENNKNIHNRWIPIKNTCIQKKKYGISISFFLDLQTSNRSPKARQNESSTTLLNAKLTLCFLGSFRFTWGRNNSASVITFHLVVSGFIVPSFLVFILCFLLF